MHNPLVSVIIPNYCHARYLDQRIQSVLNQTYQNFEVIILDDCSPDDGASRAVIEKYRDNPHVSHIVYNTENSGSTFRQWNKGFGLAKGELIWIAESDDYCEKDLMEKLIQPFLYKKQCSISFCRTVLVDEQGNMQSAGPPNLNSGIYDGGSFIRDFMSIGNSIVNARFYSVRSVCKVFQGIISCFRVQETDCSGSIFRNVDMYLLPMTD